MDFILCSFFDFFFFAKLFFLCYINALKKFSCVYFVYKTIFLNIKQDFIVLYFVVVLFRTYLVFLLSFHKKITFFCFLLENSCFHSFLLLHFTLRFLSYKNNFLLGFFACSFSFDFLLFFQRSELSHSTQLVQQKAKFILKISHKKNIEWSQRVPRRYVSEKPHTNKCNNNNRIRITAVAVAKV